MNRKPLLRLFGWCSAHRRLIQWGVAFFAVLLAGWILASNVSDLARLLRFEIWQLGAIFGVFLVHFAASTIPFLLIIRSLHGSSVSVWEWMKIMFVSRMANNIAPQSGTVYRAVVLKRETGLSYTRYVHVFALFGWLTTLLNLLLATILMVAIMPELSLGGLPGVAVTGGAFAVLLIGPVVTEKVLAAFEPREGTAARLHGALHGMFQAMVEHGRDARLLALVMGFAVARFVLWVALFRLLFVGMEVRVGYAELALFLAIYQLSALLMITPGNLGVREVIYGMVGGAVGITAAQGVMLSALLRALQYVVIFPLGLAFGGWRLVAGTDVECGKWKVESDGTDTDVEGGKSKVERERNGTDVEGGKWKVERDGNGKDVESRGTDVESRK